MADEMTEQQTFTVRVEWPDSQDVPVEIINQFAAANGLPAAGRASEGGIYLVLGHVVPPILTGSPAEIMKKAESLGGVIPVKVRGRYFLTRSRLTELISVLNRAADSYDATMERTTGDGDV